MIIKTKKYQLEHSTYKKFALENVIKSWWWAFLVPLAMCAIYGFFPKQIWIPITAVVITALYIAFGGYSFQEWFTWSKVKCFLKNYRIKSTADKFL